MKNQNQLCQDDKQDSNDCKNPVLTKVLAWFHSPIIASVALTAIFIVAFIYFQTFMSFPILIAVLSLFGIAIYILLSLTSLIFMVIKGRDKQILIKQLVQICSAVVILILVIANIRPIVQSIDFVSTYTAVRIKETRLLQQVQQSPSQSFRYSRFNFGQIVSRGRWVIYDESDQVLLAPQQRSQEWWATTKEDQEFEGCFDEARLLYSHFFIRYFYCL